MDNNKDKNSDKKKASHEETFAYHDNLPHNRFETDKGTSETKIIQTHPTSGMGVDIISGSEKVRIDPTSATKIVSQLSDMISDLTRHGSEDPEVLISNATRILQEAPKIVTELPKVNQKTFIGEDFEIIYEIGRGAMGSVYKCFQKSLQRIVALKVLSKKWTENPNFYKMLINEARMSAQLNHPNIVQVYAVANDGERDLMVMEYVQGVPLSKILAQNKHGIKPSRAYHFALQIAEALQIAHTKHLIHRDIKPDNVMVLDGDQVKVTDFGIACYVGSFASGGAKYRAGTPAFMSPEQARGDDLDGRSDLFSLGVVLYYMLTNRQPFQSDTLEDTLNKVTKNVILQELDITKDIPEEAVDFLKKALSTDPDKRFQSAEAMARALHHLALKAKIDEDEKARPVYKPQNNTPFILGGIGAVIIFFMFIWFYGDIMNFVFPNRTRTAMTNQVNFIRNEMGEYETLMKHHFDYNKEVTIKAMDTRLGGKIRTANFGNVLNYVIDIQHQLNVLQLESYFRILKSLQNKPETTDAVKAKIEEIFKSALIQPDNKYKYPSDTEKTNYFNRLALEILLEVFPEEQQDQKQ